MISRFERRGRQAVFVMLAMFGLLAVMAALEPLFNYIWPREPARFVDPNSAVQDYGSIWVRRLPDGKTVICQPAVPTDEQLDHARSMMLDGYSWDEVRKWYLDRELQAAPPQCLELGGLPQSGKRSPSNP